MRATGRPVNHGRGAGLGREEAVEPRWRRGCGRGTAGAGGRRDADPAPCCCQSAPGVGSGGARNMAAAALSFGPERESEPAKEARVVGSELVDTYTVCWGDAGTQSVHSAWNPESKSGARGGVRVARRERVEGPAVATREP